MDRDSMWDLENYHRNLSLFKNREIPSKDSFLDIMNMSC